MSEKLTINGPDELSAAVAKHVCGECVHEWNIALHVNSITYVSDYTGSVCEKCGLYFRDWGDPRRVRVIGKGEFVPYATDLNHAFAALAEHGSMIHTINPPRKGKVDYAEVHWFTKDGLMTFLRHQSLAVAICLALLRACGYEVEYTNDGGEA